MKRVNVDRMRRYSEESRQRIVQVEEEMSREEWLAAMTPQHREVHEAAQRPPLFACPFCMDAALSRMAQRMTDPLGKRSRMP